MQNWSGRRHQRGAARAAAPEDRPASPFSGVVISRAQAPAATAPPAAATLAFAIVRGRQATSNRSCRHCRRYSPAGAGLSCVASLSRAANNSRIAGLRRQNASACGNRSAPRRSPCRACRRCAAIAIAIVLEQALDAGQLRRVKAGMAGWSSKFMVQSALAAVVDRARRAARRCRRRCNRAAVTRLVQGEIAILDADGKVAAPGARRPGMGQRGAGIDQIGLRGQRFLAARSGNRPARCGSSLGSSLPGLTDRRGRGIENIAGAIAQRERGLGGRGDIADQRQHRQPCRAALHPAVIKRARAMLGEQVRAAAHGECARPG